MKHYHYKCTCLNGAEITGIYDSDQTDRDYLTDAIMLSVSNLVVRNKIPWDPFNVELVFTAKAKQPKQ